MEQLDIIKHMAAAAKRDGALVVSEIGSQTQWLYASGDEPHHLYLTGPMGMGPSVALGVALAQPDKPVLAICGDGALAMNLSALTTASYMAPKNLTIAVIDNGVYDLTGKATSPTRGMNFGNIADVFPGFEHATEIDLNADICFKSDSGLTLWHAKVTPAAQKAPPFPLQPLDIHSRFKSLFAEPS